MNGNYKKEKINMANPIIKFRLSVFQIARGLQIIRDLDPDYVPTSIGQIIKTAYFDYLAKMTMGRSNNIPQHYIDEIENLLYHTKSPKTLQEFMQKIF